MFLETDKVVDKETFIDNMIAQEVINLFTTFLNNKTTRNIQ